MKQHLTAIAFNEKELESYVSQLKSQRFEAISDVKKSDDGTFYQALAKGLKTESFTVVSQPIATVVSAPETA